MPRNSRIVVLNCPHHITQRGNNKTTTFVDNEDYVKYLSFFEKFKNIYELDVYSYSLMPNHIHFKAIPNNPLSLAKTFNYTQVSYTQYFNKKYKKVGHLWQSRFFSCPLDETHSYSVSKYIEKNPVRAGLVSTPEEWQWSSAREHLGLEKGIISLLPENKLIDVSDWKEYLLENLPLDKRQEIESHAISGYPLGNSLFLQNIESLFNLSLKKRPVGRPLL